MLNLLPLPLSTPLPIYIAVLPPPQPPPTPNSQLPGIQPAKEREGEGAPGLEGQEAKRMLPISKVDGGDHPADLMTESVGIALAIKRMSAMGIRFADGRSDAATVHGLWAGSDTPSPAWRLR